MTDSLADRMTNDQYAGYAYAYPHKTSYRPISPALPLADVWRKEDKDSLFLYVHLPFCEVRCGFCNLFTTVQPPAKFVGDTLAAIGRQSQAVAAAIGPQRVSQMAFGGGTPSYLTCAELERLFESLERDWAIDQAAIPVSFEVSPSTIDAEKLSLLKSRGIDRLSMGVQSFSASDLNSLGRPQSDTEVDRALGLIHDAAFPVFNLDLIYGSQGQTLAGWNQTIDRTVAIGPEEIYLYPLYIRELTGLSKTGKTPDASRRQLFLVARDVLLANGYEQHSMRLFRKASVKLQTDYCCQEDGMVGLGPGARSYTRSLHYSSDFAVGQSGVRKIIAAFNARTDPEYSRVDYGVRLGADEQRRRFVIKSLLRVTGLSLPHFERLFDTNAFTAYPQLREVLDLGLGNVHDDVLRLNEEGLSWSDTIGPWLYSPAVTAQMEAFELV